MDSQSETTSNQNQEKKNNRNENDKNNRVHKKIKDIIISLISIIKFEYIIENKIQQSLLQNNEQKKKIISSKNKYYLINKDFISKYKNLFLYDKLYDYIYDKNEQEDINDSTEEKILNQFKDKFKYLLENKKDDILKLFQDSNIFLLESFQFNDNYETFYYYGNFEIINEMIYKLIKYIGKKYYNVIFNKNFHEINLIINEGKIIVHNPQWEYLLILNFKYNKNEELFEIEKILKYDNSDIALEQFNLMKNSYISEIIKIDYNKQNNIIYYNEKPIGKMLSLNFDFEEKKKKKKKVKTMFKQFANNNINNNDNNNNNLIKINNNIILTDNNDINKNNFKCYLKILFEFYKTNTFIKFNMDREIDNDKEYFILNKKWTDEFKDIFFYYKIESIFNENKYLIINKDQKYTIDEIINKVSNDIPEDIKIEFYNLNKEYITQRLSNINLFNIFEKNFSNYLYFEECGIINQNLLKLMKDNEIDIMSNLNKERIKNNKGIFMIGKGRIFINFNLKNNPSINIGKIKNDLFITEILIDCNNPEKIEKIKDSIKEEGYEYIKELLNKYQKIKLNNDTISLLIKENKLKEIIENKKKNLSKNIEILLFLSIHHQKNILRIKNQKLEKAFLININLLNKFSFDKIHNMINENKNIREIFYNNSNTNKILSGIINYLDLNILNEIDKLIKSINSEEIKDELFFYEMEDVKLSEEKMIKIINNLNNFIIINEAHLNSFKEVFIPKKNIPIINIIFGNKINIIKFNINEQNTTILGSFKKNENIFSLDFIIDFKEEEYLDDNLNEIITDYNSFKRKKILFFNNGNENNYVSPIYGDNEALIGYYYKYDKDLVNNDFSKYNYKKQLIKIIRLYTYYTFLKKKLNSSNENIMELSTDEYYLVNSNWLGKFKSAYDYDKISEKLNSSKNVQKIINEIFNDKDKDYKFIDKKKIFSIIQYLSPEIIEEFNLKNVKKTIKSLNIEPNIIPINYYNNSQEIKQLMIYNNFEILNKNIIELFSNSNNFNQKMSNCFIKDNYFIINFLTEININEKFISIIGSLDNNFIFKEKYALIYEKETYREKNIEKLKKSNLNKYLNGLNLLNNSQPITNRKYKIIGTIIKIEDNNYNSNNSPHNINNNIKINNFVSNDKTNNNSTLSIDNNIEEYNKENCNIKNNFKFSPHIGLTNIGATCYMNATLQCFCHIEKFINYFKYNI